MYDRSLTSIKMRYTEALDSLYILEDLTNYDIKSLSKIINLMQKIDIDKEFKKYNVN